MTEHYYLISLKTGKLDEITYRNTIFRLRKLTISKCSTLKNLTPEEPDCKREQKKSTDFGSDRTRFYSTDGFDWIGSHDKIGHLDGTGYSLSKNTRHHFPVYT